MRHSIVDLLSWSVLVVVDFDLVLSLTIQVNRNGRVKAQTSRGFCTAEATEMWMVCRHPVIGISHRKDKSRQTSHRHYIKWSDSSSTEVPKLAGGVLDG
jgi:hypothetical protein